MGVGVVMERWEREVRSQGFNPREVKDMREVDEACMGAVPFAVDGAVAGPPFGRAFDLMREVVVVESGAGIRLSSVGILCLVS